MYIRKIKFPSILSCLLLVAGLFSCVPMDNSYNGGYNNGGGYGYGNPYGGGGYRDPYYNGGYGNNYDYNRRERDRLEQERREIQDERRRIEAERERQQEAQRQQQHQVEDRCPPGFSTSENKCSQEERRRGCRDIRLPSGRGCVSR